MRAVHETMGRIEIYIQDRAGTDMCCPVCRSRLKRKGPGPATRLRMRSERCRGRCLCGNGIYDSSYGQDHTGLREGEFMETILGHVKRACRTW